MNALTRVLSCRAVISTHKPFLLLHERVKSYYQQEHNLHQFFIAEEESKDIVFSRGEWFAFYEGMLLDVKEIPSSIYRFRSV